MEQRIEMHFFFPNSGIKITNIIQCNDLKKAFQVPANVPPQSLPALESQGCTRARGLYLFPVHTREPAVTSDQEAYHSCFQDLISAASAKSPLGSQFSFLLIGALIRSEKKAHCVCPLKKLDSAEASRECRCVPACEMKEEPWGWVRRKKKNNCILRRVFVCRSEAKQ